MGTARLKKASILQFSRATNELTKMPTPSYDGGRNTAFCRVDGLMRMQAERLSEVFGVFRVAAYAAPAPLRLAA
jgi:hypothetical protein